MNRQSRSAEHFERLYQDNPDPWNFKTSAYEHQKYEATLSALGTRRFEMALEVGCSIGILTRRLASRCDRLLGVDFVPAAVAMARSRCGPLPGVSIERMQIPQQWPEGQFDLILFSEVLYFLDEGDLRETCDQTLRSLLPGGLVLLVNYTGKTDDPITGDDAASLFIKASFPYLRPILQNRESLYRLDLLAGD
jgi:SAM-dependent methyltransferase